MNWKRQAIELVEKHDGKEPVPNWANSGVPVCSTLCPHFRVSPGGCALSLLMAKPPFTVCGPVATGMAQLLDAQSKLSTLEKLKKLLVRS